MPAKSLGTSVIWRMSGINKMEEGVGQEKSTFTPEAVAFKIPEAKGSPRVLLGREREIKEGQGGQNAEEREN